ncbi:Lipoxygenase [Quillaja saponaria]|uniref:Lipoxygenase n=1 Tax=Quillaja saponaria TaxID=32244 RepID=A0AAD7PZR9_QUISA|nr:Lipoxygenase [Quillaja saponaria]
MSQNNIVDVLNDGTNNGINKKKIMGTVILMKKNVLDFTDLNASVLDRLHEMIGKNISIQLISAVNVDLENGLKGKLGKSAHLEDWITTVTPLTAGETAFKTLTLEDVPGQGQIHFVCNSWVYPSKKYKTDRIFFANKTYLPSETPILLLKYREEELVNLRGDGKGELQEWDPVYEYAFYNDLGNPDKGEKHIRPVLGASSEYPYPRRGRTGRSWTKTDHNTESRLNLLMSLNIYVPRDERFGHLKLSDFLACALKAIFQFLRPELEALFDNTPNEFDSFQDMLKLYEGGIKLPTAILDNIREHIPAEMLKEIFRTDGNRTAWRTDEEFAREMLAGMHPVMISHLQEFPPESKLDELYEFSTSATVKAIAENRLFILDYHDALMPYLRRINSTSTKTYASRTVLFLKDDGTLRSLAIELSLPHPDGDEFGAISKVYKPAEQGVESSIWQLAKAYVAVNDSGYHQLISHWLHTHAVIEPFVIATNRQLSVLHPIYKLLHPHFRDTMNINAIARQTLINAGGFLELTVFPARYAMEFSSIVYKDWVFPEQALPADLIKRGLAVKDPTSPHGLRLLIEDYPYAVDGLEIWSSIKTWVQDYCSFYYDNDDMVRKDSELQSWWTELREEGHGDKKDEPWWPKMQTRKELIESCTIIIWIASALHAAVNFGQYSYGGYLPNQSNYKPAIHARRRNPRI